MNLRTSIGSLLLLSVVVVTLVTLFSACASAPPETFFTLSSSVRAAARPPAPFPRSVVVARAGLPDSIDRPQLVTVVGANRIEILEQKRWGEPLRVAIPRVVAESLTHLLGTWRVSSREEAIDNPDCRVDLDFRRFEARVGSAVTVHALWTVACQGAEKRMGQSVGSQSLVDGSADAPFPGIVAAQGRALDLVSRDIARALLDLPSPTAAAPPPL